MSGLRDMEKFRIRAYLVAAAFAVFPLFISASTARAQANSGPPAKAPSEEQSTPPASHVHKITVKFDYDFSKTPSCAPPKVKDKCVTRFNIYDISAGVKNRAKLFSVPAPVGETGHVTGITATSPGRTFESGKHLIGVATQEPDGTESDPRGCTIWVTIP